MKGSGSFACWSVLQNKPLVSDEVPIDRIEIFLHVYSLAVLVAMHFIF